MGKIIDVSSIKDKQNKNVSNETNAIDDKIVKCPKCNGLIYVSGVVLQKVSALESPQGQAGVMPVSMPLICMGCGRVMEQNDLGISDPSNLIVTPQ